MAGTFLSMSQLAYYAAQAGFTGDALRNIVAISWAESGGKIDAIGDGGDSYGLLQINLPSHKGVDGQRLLTDPLYAFQQAYIISSGGKNLSPWTTWSHRTSAGASANAQQYLTQASAAVQEMNGVAATSGNFNLAPTTSPRGDMAPRAPATMTNTTTSTGLDGSTITTASAAPSDALPPNATPDQIEKYIRAHYPDAAGFLANPEIKKILFDSALAGDDEAEIAAKIRKTDYWATHGPTSRAFDLLLAQDSKAAVDLIDNVKGVLGDLMTRQGLTVNDEQLGSIAKNAIRLGWVDLNGNVANEGKLGDFVAWQLRLQNPGDKRLPTGDAAANADSLGAIAKSFYVPMTQNDLNDWALKIMEGTATQDSFTSYVKTLARARFVNDKSVLAAIDAGIAPSDYFRPIQNVVAQTLGLNPMDVDLNSSKYMALTGMYDQAAGMHRAMTLNEAAQWARNQPEYAKTPEYRQQDASIAMQLAKEFGAVA